MGEYWTKHLLNSGRRMNAQQIRRVDYLELQIARCLAEIEALEAMTAQCVEVIDRIKRGGKLEKAKHLGSGEEIPF